MIYSTARPLTAVKPAARPPRHARRDLDRHIVGDVVIDARPKRGDAETRSLRKQAVHRRAGVGSLRRKCGRTREAAAGIDIGRHAPEIVAEFCRCHGVVKAAKPSPAEWRKAGVELHAEQKIVVELFVVAGEHVAAKCALLTFHRGERDPGPDIEPVPDRRRRTGIDRHRRDRQRIVRHGARGQKERCGQECRSFHRRRFTP